MFPSRKGLGITYGRRPKRCDRPASAAGKIPSRSFVVPPLKLKSPWVFYILTTAACRLLDSIRYLAVSSDLETDSKPTSDSYTSRRCRDLSLPPSPLHHWQVSPTLLCADVPHRALLILILPFAEACDTDQARTQQQQRGWLGNRGRVADICRGGQGIGRGTREDG